MIKFPYKATMRYADGGTFDVQWFRCNPGAACVPFPTAFGSSSFDPTRFDQGQIGEIPVVYRQHTVGFLDEWLTGDHTCGDEESWQDGWPLDTGFVAVGDDGIPPCCSHGLGGAFDCGFDFGFDTGGACEGGAFDDGYDFGFDVGPDES